MVEGTEDLGLTGGGNGAPAPASAGAGPDVDGLTGKPHEGDSATPPGGTPPAAGDGAGDEQPFSLQIGEETYSEQQVLEAFEALRNKARWEGDLHQRGEALNALQRRLEAARLGIASHPGQPSAQPSTPAANLPITGEQLRNLLLDKPDEGLQTLVDLIRNEVGTTSSQQIAQQHFLGTHKDFYETIEAPEFRNFFATLPTDTQGNPLYNQVDAFLAYKLTRAEARLSEAEKAGFLKGEENARKNLDAKSRIRILRGAGGAPPPPGTGPDVKNMSQGEFLNAATQFLLNKRGGQ